MISSLTQLLRNLKLHLLQMIIPLSIILEDPLLVKLVIPNLCVLFLLSFLRHPCNVNQSCNYLKGLHFLLSPLGDWSAQFYSTKSSIQPYKSTSNDITPKHPTTVLFNSSSRPQLHNVLSLQPEKEKEIDQPAILSLLPCT